MNKGFTLIELLAVVIILSLLAALASISVTKIVRDSKNELYQSQISSIKSAAVAWGADNPDKLPDSGKCKYINLKYLKEYGLFDESVINPKTGKEFDDDIIIRITNEKTVHNTENIIYEVDSDDISMCLPAMPICKLVSDSDDSDTITMGDKYSCKVNPSKDNYTFYVLTTPNTEDDKVNLIMDQNINSDGTPAGMTGVTQSTNETQYNLVAWNKESGQSTNAYGPVTAMQFLHNATKDWANIAPVNYIYNDKNVQGTTAANTSYTSFVSTNGVAVITPLSGEGVTIGSQTEPLRARMPIYSSDATKTEVTDIANASHLYHNLDSSGSSAPYGYWTLSSRADNSSRAWRTVYYGGLHYGTIDRIDYYGVRPVITLDKTMLYD